MPQERKSNKISYDLITFLFKKNEKKKNSKFRNIASDLIFFSW